MDSILFDYVSYVDLYNALYDVCTFDFNWIQNERITDLAYAISRLADKAKTLEGLHSVVACRFGDDLANRLRPVPDKWRIRSYADYE